MWPAGGRGIESEEVNASWAQNMKGMASPVLECRKNWCSQKNALDLERFLACFIPNTFWLFAQQIGLGYCQ